jgi:hypothetical protein
MDSRGKSRADLVFQGIGRTKPSVRELIKVHKSSYGSSFISFFGADYVDRLGVYLVVVLRLFRRIEAIVSENNILRVNCRYRRPLLPLNIICHGIDGSKTANRIPLHVNVTISVL